MNGSCLVRSPGSEGMIGENVTGQKMQKRWKRGGRLQGEVEWIFGHGSLT